MYNIFTNSPASFALRKNSSVAVRFKSWKNTVICYVALLAALFKQELAYTIIVLLVAVCFTKCVFRVDFGRHFITKVIGLWLALLGQEQF